MLTKPFEKLSRSDAAIAGGKGASLGEMTQAGIPVPSGFVVLSESFERFIEETDINVEIDNILHDVDPTKMHTVEHASETIQKLILEVEMPEDIAEKIRTDFKTLNAKYVAVRSSATAEDSDSAAWAGQLDSFLNTTEATLLLNVQRCWASLFTPRAIFYRFEKELHTTKISVAVVVQKMVESEVSGIAFSVHPVTEDRNQLIIEAGYGLGEAIVSGQITPDSYVVEKSPRHIIDKNVADQERGIYRSLSVIPAQAGIQEEEIHANEWRPIPSDKRSLQKLSDEQILELSDLIVKIENHYGFPYDIEWAYENKKFYIVQSRPITTLSSSDVLLKSERIKALVNTFSREKKLYYFDLWDYCDKEGVRRYFGERMENNLFVVPPKGMKGSVWHESEEMSKLKSVAVEVFQEFGAGSVWERVKTDAHKAWDFLKPYAEGKDITDIEEWKTYQEHLLLFWTAMNSVTWEAIDDPKTPKQVRDDFIALREVSERFVERTSALATDFFENTVSSWSNLSHVLTFAEMVAIAEKRSVDKDEISKRTKGCFLFRGTVHASLNQLEEILRGNGLRQERVHQEDIEQIKGVSAFKGTVSGHVKLVNKKEELSKVDDGDILVTQMTSPDYVPTIKKAGAVVTDEGGSLCHAAIIARELKKPCIIGTKIATQVLKDGDLVEVDAERGVVTILEKAEGKREETETNKK